MTGLLNFVALLPLLFSSCFSASTPQETYCIIQSKFYDKDMKVFLEECETIAFPVLTIDPKNWSLSYPHDTVAWKIKDGKLVEREDLRNQVKKLTKSYGDVRSLLIVDLFHIDIGDQGSNTDKINEIVNLAQQNGYNGILVWHGSLYHKNKEAFPAEVLSIFLDAVISQKTKLKWNNMQLDVMVNSDVCTEEMSWDTYEEHIQHYVLSSADFSHTEPHETNPLMDGDKSIASTIESCTDVYSDMLPKLIVILHAGLTVYTVDEVIKGGVGYMKSMDFYGYQEACEVLSGMNGLVWDAENKKALRVKKKKFVAYLDTIDTLNEKVKYLMELDVFGIGVVTRSLPTRENDCGDIKHYPLKAIRGVLSNMKRRMKFLNISSKKAFKLVSGNSRLAATTTKVLKTLSGQNKAIPDCSRSFTQE